MLMLSLGPISPPLFMVCLHLCPHCHCLLLSLPCAGGGGWCLHWWSSLWWSLHDMSLPPLPLMCCGVVFVGRSWNFVRSIKNDMYPVLAKILSKAHCKATVNQTIRIDFDAKGIGASERVSGPSGNELGLPFALFFWSGPPVISRKVGASVLLSSCHFLAFLLSTKSTLVFADKERKIHESGGVAKSWQVANIFNQGQSGPHPYPPTGAKVPSLGGENQPDYEGPVYDIHVSKRCRIWYFFIPCLNFGCHGMYNAGCCCWQSHGVSQEATERKHALQSARVPTPKIARQLTYVIKATNLKIIQMRPVDADIDTEHSKSKLQKWVECRKEKWLT